MKFRFVAQDSDSTVCRFYEVPRHAQCGPYWVSSGAYNIYGTEFNPKPVTDWHERVVDLSTHDWDLDKDGLLIAVEKGKGHEANRCKSV